MKSSFKINGVSVKAPTDFKIERYNVTNLERTANGDMAGDLIAQKKKFYFTYESITATELNKILDAIWSSRKIFYDLQYVENNVTHTVKVYSGSIPTELARTGGEWVWKNLQFNLIQK